MTATGGRWANGTVTRMLKNPTIAGLRSHARTGTIKPGNWTSIITPTQRELIIALFNDPARPRRGGGPTNRKRLLSGLLVCAQCGSKMYGDGPTGYVCHKSWKGCGNVRIASAPLEDHVTWQAYGHLDELRAAGMVTETRRDNALNEALVEERLGLLQRRDELAVKLAEGILDDRAYKVGAKALDRHISSVEERLSASIRRETVSEEELSLVIAPVVGRSW